SSRRRHTRCYRDWSSDVCSSDLQQEMCFLQAHADSAEAHFLLGFILFREIGAQWLETGKTQEGSSRYNSGNATGLLAEFRDAKEIGRASCRERVWSRREGASGET